MKLKNNKEIKRGITEFRKERSNNEKTEAKRMETENFYWKLKLL